MVTTPANIPETTPVAEPTVALVIELLLQVPPGDGSVKVVVAPSQTPTPVAGFIANGLAFTVTVPNAIHEPSA